jgi:hypothetical protein
MTHRENVLKRFGLTGPQSMETLSKVSGISIDTLQEVYNRGIGAYKTNPTSVRMLGSFEKNVRAPMSMKLSKEQWAAARVYSFLDGNPKHDNDLRRRGGGMELSAGAEKQAEAYRLGDDDIRKLLGSDIKITSYPALEHIHDIGQLFDKHGRAVLFFPQESQSVGHWIGLIKDGRQIEFFDSYGHYPDTQKPDKDTQISLNMDKPLLTRLLEDAERSGYRIIYNKVAMQKTKDDVQTCGRQVVCRLLYSRYPISRYREMIKKTGMTPDEFVTRETIESLGK